ncbi:hypothetical protein AAF712_015508 [Marasmius tenuissimus]|uniref:F-box domain-containing protein n=1 Tax=Marasmius tenuissimus TaxID=585030 RepID=A0ABR2ZA90_9AGAR
MPSYTDTSSIPHHASSPPLFPSEILREVVVESLSDESITVASKTQRVCITRERLLTPWKDSSLRKLSQVCHQWREVVRDLPIWQDVQVIHDDIFPALPCLGLSLEDIIELAEAKGRKFAIELKIYGFGYWLHSPTFKRLLASTVGWKSFRYIANIQVPMQLTCDAMDLLEPHMTETESLVMSINEHGAVAGYTLWSLAARLAKLRCLKSLTIAWDPIRDRKVWSWGSTWQQYPAQINIQRLNVGCTPATALWMMRQCSRVEKVALFLRYEEEKAQRPVAEGTVLRLGRLQDMKLGMEQRAVDETFVTLMDTLECPQIRRFEVTWRNRVERRKR